MRSGRPKTLLALAFLFALGPFSCAPLPSGEESVPTGPRIPARIVAIGDLHGDLEATRNALRLAGAINFRNRWVGGDLVVVQTGDILDRGDDEREILELFERLQSEAHLAGGAVHLLNGNHELMNAYLDFRYVTEHGFTEFADMVAIDPADSLLNSLEPGERARAAAFRPGGPLALKLALQPTALVIGPNVFVHGGILPAQVKLGLDRVNTVVQRWLRNEAPQPEWIRGDNSPVWSRLFSGQPDAAACDTLEAVLEDLGVRRMVVGHTVQRTGITAFCGGRVWCIDVGLAAHYGGRPEVLEIRGDVVRSLR